MIEWITHWIILPLGWLEFIVAAILFVMVVVSFVREP